MMAEMIASGYKTNSVDGEWLINQIKDTFVDHFGEYATWKMKDFLNYILKAQGALAKNFATYSLLHFVIGIPILLLQRR